MLAGCNLALLVNSLDVMKLRSTIGFKREIKCRVFDVVDSAVQRSVDIKTGKRIDLRTVQDVVSLAAEKRGRSSRISVTLVKGKP